jgi:capsular exopolysaccharide synthesis family protein
MPDKKATGWSGKAARRDRRPSGGKLERLTAARDPAVARGTQLAGLAARQFRRIPGAPGGWARFLMAHLRWILIITLVVAGAAGALAHRQTRQYKSQASVNVWFSSPDASALVQPPNMVTEKGIVSSGVVLAIASRTLHVAPWALLPGLSVTVPASSSLLQVGYSDPVPRVARERAQAIANAYVAYRTPKAVPRSTKSVTPVIDTLRAALITSASLPTSPSSPKYLLDIIVALIVGLGLAIGTAAIRDHLDDRFRSPFDLEDQTGAPLLALVPAFRTFRRDMASQLAIVWSPDSVVAEAYRSLRTRVVAAGAARGARTLLITSPAWEKRSMIAANLAAALAQAGRFTVLVSADLRWGRAHELLGVDNEGGLARLLDRRTDLAGALRVTGVRGLRVLPAGPLPHDPAELLQRPALRTVLDELRGDADFVIIDAPPLLATPDTAPLAHLAEMILLVGDARKSTRAHLQAALREVDDTAGKLVGSVLYNVGRRHWLRQPRGPASALDAPDLDAWSWRDVVDGRQAAPQHPRRNNVSLATGPHRGDQTGTQDQEGGY